MRKRLQTIHPRNKWLVTRRRAVLQARSEALRGHLNFLSRRPVRRTHGHAQRGNRERLWVRLAREQGNDAWPVFEREKVPDCARGKGRMVSVKYVVQICAIR